MSEAVGSLACLILSGSNSTRESLTLLSGSFVLLITIRCVKITALEVLQCWSTFTNLILSMF